MCLSTSAFLGACFGRGRASCNTKISFSLQKSWKYPQLAQFFLILCVCVCACMDASQKRPSFCSLSNGFHDGICCEADPVWWLGFSGSPGMFGAEDFNNLVDKVDYFSLMTYDYSTGGM